MSIQITARKNGPFIVEGDFSDLSLTDSDGNPMEVQPMDVGGKPQVFLCRCGSSSMKPYCDGGHLKAGFKSE